MKKIGLQVMFQNYGDSIPDVEHIKCEIEIARMAEPLGMDEIWPVEHHFTDYSACPDNTQFLSYMAGITSTIRLATGVITLPWNDPVRVAEKMTFLDHLSDGRAVFGIGRGLGHHEYCGLVTDKDESKARFCESADRLISALESGLIEGDGKYFKQSKVEIRPRPISSWKNRFYSVAMSPDSVVQAARMGAQLILFSNRTDQKLKELIDIYNHEYRKYHDDEPKLPRICDFIVCSEDPIKVQKLAEDHIGAYFASWMDHYERSGDYLEHADYFPSYSGDGSVLEQADFEVLMEEFIGCNLYGTPENIIDKVLARQSVVGEYEQNICVRYGGIDQLDAKKSLALFMNKVVPALRTN